MLITKKGKRGQKVSNGNTSPSFQDYLNKLGIDKQEILKQFEEQGETIAQKVINRSVGLKVYDAMISPIIAYFNDTHSRGVSLQEDLYLLESDLIAHRLKKESEDPDWNPLEDKVYQQGLVRKGQLLQYINRFNLDYAKLKAEMAKKGYNDKEVINVTEMTRDED